MREVCRKNSPIDRQDKLDGGNHESRAKILLMQANPLQETSKSAGTVL
jgi:hypothetical protein